MDPSKIDKTRLPRHVAIIMDGNGRWAKQQGFRTRIKGHENGVEALRNAATACAELGVSYLTVYAFSTENWNRPKTEVNALMRLLIGALTEELDTLRKNKIRLKAIGQLDNLPTQTRKQLDRVIEQTRENDHMTLTLALSYSSKSEILDAVRQIAREVAYGQLNPEEIDENCISNHLYTCDMPDPDLLIRTSGEYRISNYLLWQIAYTELHFTSKLWPDFTKEDLYTAILDYQGRERRFGQTGEQVKVV
jgi:undecaprenyl diphosphate synthase